MKLQGVFTALVTPFHKDGSLDEKALRKLVDFQIDQGISGLVPVGTTGESPTLTHQEHHQVIDIVIEQAAGRVPVIAGTGSNSTAEAVSLTQHAQKAGADYTLQVAPYYNKPSQEGFYRHFMTVAEEGGLPVVVYNIPGRSGKNIENETMLRLAEHPQIVGVKEASGSIAQIMNLCAAKPESFSVLSGDDNLGLPLMACGGDGIVSVASNIIPAEMEALVAALLGGEAARGRELHYKWLPLFKGMFLDTNPIPIKCACALMGMMEESYRLPLTPLSDENRRALNEIMSALKLI